MYVVASLDQVLTMQSIRTASVLPALVGVFLQVPAAVFLPIRICTFIVLLACSYRSPVPGAFTGAFECQATSWFLIKMFMIIFDLTVWQHCSVIGGKKRPIGAVGNMYGDLVKREARGHLRL